MVVHDGRVGRDLQVKRLAIALKQTYEVGTLAVQFL